MLTIKEINEISFGKAGFSGYKPEDVDKFIDEVAESFKELENQRDEAQRRLQEVSSQNAALSAKNAEIQKKLSILAKEIDTYRENEDSIKEVLISAQRLARDSVKEAQDKAAQILKEAQDEAQKIVENAKEDNHKTIEAYAAQTEEKREELEEMKRQVSAFRASLMEMYKKHLECIDHIPNFKVKERPAQPEEPKPEEPAPDTAEKPQAEEKPQEPEAAPQLEEPQAAEPPKSEPEPVPQPEPAPASVPVASVPQPRMNRPVYQESQEIVIPTLQDRVDYRGQTRPVAPAPEDFPPEDDLSEVGINIHAYDNIPESLRREKQNHFSDLEFGDDVDLGKRRRKR